jgi:hypothetical protein
MHNVTIEGSMNKMHNGTESGENMPHFISDAIVVAYIVVYFANLVCLDQNHLQTLSLLEHSMYARIHHDNS